MVPKSESHLKDCGSLKGIESTALYSKLVGDIFYSEEQALQSYFQIEKEKNISISVCTTVMEAMCRQQILYSRSRFTYIS